ncbi:S phase cyclin A-associated protein in the endoplasmic reticulum [Daktulosphaira vitifoliae]|uniref:S phase cyclin A-associated protein in the endoplasmic reticulum n=1 Tax=Daktulosphaira vitifoliae TaxID=58002 RepID=UPI0021A9ADEB|nr:S phase cyclin A-associated protein in the endoplasmic reticulum [Daktulosphaira vitifoliae]XP_050542281.1 S phase cyclin A-associated protein in the endoplasmic reticulum [Daktulosphaira vitifoliae]
MEIGINNVIGNRMRMWPNRQTLGLRIRSASAGRDKRSELRNRSWIFLFDNLRRNIDEIYQICETDENVYECKEAIMVLQNYIHDFHSLVEWFRLKWEYEHTDPPQRPNFLAWEIRGASPRKMLQKRSCVSPGLTRRKLDLLSESLNDKSISDINENDKKNNLSEKIFSNQYCQTDFEFDQDITKKVFQPITKPIVKSSVVDNVKNKKIPVFVPKPVKGVKQIQNDKEKHKIEPLKRNCVSISHLSQSTSVINRKTLESSRKSSSNIQMTENKLKIDSKKIITSINNSDKLLKNNDRNSNINTTNSIINELPTIINKNNLKIDLSKSKKKSVESLNVISNEKKNKIIRSKTSIDIKPPKMSKRGIVKGNDGWETVIRSRRSNPLTQSSSSIKLKAPNDVKKRFQVPSSAHSMPTLALDIASSPEELEPKSTYPDKNDRPIISNAVTFPKKKRKTEKPLEKKFKKIDQIRKEILKNEIEERRMCDEELLRNRQFFDEEMLLAREIRELENAESSCSDDMTQSDRYSDLLDNMILTERMYTINEIKALIEYGNESAIYSIGMQPWDIGKSTESIKQTYSARQAKAHQKRQQLLQDKSSKVRELLKKVGERKMLQTQLIDEKRVNIDKKLKRAEENRKQHLQQIQKKAHDEEEKLREIAFINELEAQNRRHDILTLWQEQEDRLQTILEERKRNQERKAAKEAAVEERLKALEVERQERIEQILERRRIKEERIGREQQEKEKERLELAREKAKERENKLTALYAAQVASTEELQKKIQQKQKESAKRHEQNIEHIRQRALELGVQKNDVDMDKYCSPCEIIFDTVIALHHHLRTKTHRECTKKTKRRIKVENVSADKFSKDVNKKKLKIANSLDSVSLNLDSVDEKPGSNLQMKNNRKRCLKLRHKMLTRRNKCKDNISKSDVSIDKTTIEICVNSIAKHLKELTNEQWSKNIIKNLETKLLFLEKRSNEIPIKDFQLLVSRSNGLNSLNNILILALNEEKSASYEFLSKIVFKAIKIYKKILNINEVNTASVMYSANIFIILDFLLVKLNKVIPESGIDNNFKLKTSTDCLISGQLLDLLSVVMLSFKHDELEDKEQINDFLSYICYIGILEKMNCFFTLVRDCYPETNENVSEFVIYCLNFISSLSKINTDLFVKKFIEILKNSELMGVMPVLYSILLRNDCSTNGLGPIELSLTTLKVTKALFNMLTSVAKMDSNTFQEVLKVESLSVQFRHIARYLLWFCSEKPENRDLLNEVIVAVGYFSLNSSLHQSMLQSGPSPTVLQLLCNLPFQYFSNPTLISVLFPTLLACCSNNAHNRALVETEICFDLLEEFQNSALSQDIPMIQFIK